MAHLYSEAEKFIKEIYWTESHDKGSKLNIAEVIAERLVKDNQDKDPEYYNHRPGVIHVSSLSKCLRGVVHDMLGTPKDERDPTEQARKLGVFKAGNLFEDYIVEALRPWMLDRQTEYVYDLGNGIILTGRDDGTIEYEGQRRMLECKSVHSDSFWHRQREGELVAYQNQMQIQTYLWLRRILPNVFHRHHYEDHGTETEIIYTNMTKQALWEYRGMRGDDKLEPQEKPDWSDLNGSFAYISKDDCTVAQAPVKFNMRIINETVLPALQWVMDAYLAKTPEVVPLPPLAVYDKSRGQWKKNWLCTYCEHHCSCAGAGWVMEAQAEVARLNKEGTLSNPHSSKPAKPLIFSVPSGTAIPPLEPGVIIPSTSVDALEVARAQRIEENAMLASAELGVDTPVEMKGQIIGVDIAEHSSVDKGSMVIAHKEGDTLVVDKVIHTEPTTPIEGETTVERLLRETRAKLESEGIIPPKSGL